MKQLILLLFVLSACVQCNARDNYIAYHKAVIRCEEQFLYKNDIPAALRAYQQLLRKTEKPFAKDCFIALQLAAFTGDKALSYFFFEKSFEQGVDMAAVKRSYWLAKMLAEDAALNNKVQQLYTSKHQHYGKTIDSNLRSRIIQLKNRDDSFKMRTQGLPMGSQMNKMRQEYIAVLDAQTQELVALTRKYGYPGDRLVGLMDYGFGDEDQRIRHCYTLRSLTDQLFYHHSCCFIMLGQELMQSVEDGLLTPTAYASFHDWAYKDIKNGREELKLCAEVQKTMVPRYNIRLAPWEKNEDTVFVNKCRAEIGMASLEHTRLKQAFAKEHNMQLFFGMFEEY